MKQNTIENKRSIIRKLQADILELSIAGRTEAFKIQANKCLETINNHFGMVNENAGVLSIVAFIVKGIGLDGKHSSEEKKLVKEWAKTFENKNLGAMILNILDNINNHDLLNELSQNADSLFENIARVDEDLIVDLFSIFLLIATIDGEVTRQEEDYLIKMFF